MTSGPYSPLTLTANAGLLNNTALEIPKALQDAVDNYLAAIATIDPPPIPGVDPPVLLDEIPPGYVFTGLTATTVTGAITEQAERLIRPDLSETCQIFSTCSAYRIMANQAVNSVKNVDAMATAFTNMNDLSTGGITQITTDPSVMGGDLQKLGNLINLKNIDYLGYPAMLLAQILNVGGLLPGLRDILWMNNIGDQTILDIKQSPATVTQEVNARIYTALVMVSGRDLDQIKELLDITTEGLDTAADLLDPEKILPKSYSTLVEPPIGFPLEANATYQILKKVIPPDQALANTKLVYGFNQVKNIKNIDFAKFAGSVAAMEKTTATDSSTILPPNAATAITNKLATGTGPDDTLTIYDFLGTAVGYPHTEILNSIAEQISSGTYDVSALTIQYNEMCAQISREITNLENAQVDFASIKPSLSAAMSLASSLHDIGLDTTEHGPNQWLTAAADPATTGGQAVVGSLKEGRNIDALQATGVGTNTQLSAS